MNITKKTIKDIEEIYEEVRCEISRVNDTAGETIFNPFATEMLDKLEDIIFSLSEK